MLRVLALKYEKKLATVEPVIGCKALRAAEIERILINYRIGMNSKNGKAT